MNWLAYNISIVGLKYSRLYISNGQCYRSDGMGKDYRHRLLSAVLRTCPEQVTRFSPV